MATLFVLASARHLIPNLCTTLGAVEDSSVAPVAMANCGGCCTAPPTNDDENTSSRLILTSTPDASAPCPFCSMATATATASCHHVHAAPGELRTSAQISHTRIFSNRTVLETKTLRGPPTLS